MPIFGKIHEGLGIYSVIFDLFDYDKETLLLILLNYLLPHSPLNLRKHWKYLSSVHLSYTLLWTVIFLQIT